MRRGRPVHFELRLATDLIDRSLVGELSYKLVRLNVDVLLAWGRLGSFHVACEELFSGLGSLLLEALRVVLALVGLEELVWVGARRDHHRGVGASAKHALVVHNVLGIVLIGACAAVGVLVLLLLSDYAGVRGEALATRTVRLLQHF